MNFVAIIPSLGALGPLGLLALLAPAAFAALMLWMRRWKAALGAASAMSTVFLLQGWWQPALKRSWWGTRAGFWAIMAGIAVAFFFWARFRARRTGRFAEWAALLAVTIGCVGISFFGELVAGHSTELRVEWIFEGESPGAILNSPLVTADGIYLGLTELAGFQQAGEIVALDRGTGNRVASWKGRPELRAVYASPAFHNGRLYVGEGLHSDRGCRLQCLDITGPEPLKRWAFETGGHIESSPVLAATRVYFGAGDDGLYCLESETGKSVWHLENLHIDATPLVHEGVVYVGSYQAEDNKHKDLRLLAVDAASGQVIWNEPTNLSSYGSPVKSGDSIYFTLGVGNLDSSGPHPAGAVVAISAATGRQVWRANFPDSVFGSPLVDDRYIVVTCHDGRVYWLHRFDGSIRWQFDLGSRAVAGPAYDYNMEGPSVVTVSKSGRLVKLALWSSELRNELDLVRAANGTSGQFISSPIIGRDKSGRQRIYVSGSITRGIRETPAVFCIVDDN